MAYRNATSTTTTNLFTASDDQAVPNTAVINTADTVTYQNNNNALKVLLSKVGTNTTVRFEPIINAYKIVGPAGVYSEDVDYETTGTNDQVIIQQAIDAVFALGGGWVFLREGTYNITSSIVIKTGVRLSGEGWDFVNPVGTMETTGTRLVATGTFTNGVINSNNLAVENVTLENFMIVGGVNGSEVTGSGIKLGDGYVADVIGGAPTHNCLIDRVYVRGFTGEGIRIQIPVASRIVNCLVRRVFLSGIILRGGTSVHLDTCYILDSRQAGFRLRQMAYSSLTACAMDYARIGYMYEACNTITETSCGSEVLIPGDTTFWYATHRFFAYSTGITVTGGYSTRFVGFVGPGLPRYHYYSEDSRQTTMIGCYHHADTLTIGGETYEVPTAVSFTDGTSDLSVLNRYVSGLAGSGDVKAGNARHVPVSRQRLITQALSAGANTIVHNMNLLEQANVTVLIYNAATNAPIATTAVAPITPDSTSVSVAAAVANARIIISG